MAAEKKEIVAAVMQIKRIKQLSFAIDESVFKGGQMQSSINLQYRFDVNLEQKFLNFILRVAYLQPETNKEFIQSEVQTVYEIDNMQSFVDKNGNPDLPSNVLIFVCSSSIAHTRALVAASLGGTAYNETILPIMDTVAVARHFFGDKIKDDLKDVESGMITAKEIVSSQ